MRAYDSIVESVCDIMRDDGDIRRTLKTRLEDLEPKSSIDSKKQKLEEDREWLRKSLMWISSGPSM